MSSVIRFENVSKGFNFWSERHQSIKTWLVRAAHGQFTSGQKNRVEVIKDISFDIQAGEFVAIMGRNGAGKSTTLKLISDIYEPDQGRIVINGAIAPMIELGSGFDFELSGYENILLHAAVLGFSRKETLKSLDAILEFSEIGKFIEMPIKNYSSGMLVRLGFSIATQLWAPILLVDEVLSVGDVGFQTKCVKKIQQLHAEGRTVVLVTHSPAQAAEFTQRTILIDAGRKVYDGSSKQGGAAYASLFKDSTVQIAPVGPAVI